MTWTEKNCILVQRTLDRVELYTKKKKNKTWTEIATNEKGTQDINRKLHPKEKEHKTLTNIAPNEKRSTRHKQKKICTQGKRNTRHKQKIALKGKGTQDMKKKLHLKKKEHNT